MIAATGRFTIALVREWGTFALFILRSLWSLLKLRAFFRRVSRAIYEMGVRCAPIIVTVGCFTGLVLGLQGYFTLSKIGSEFILGSTVALALIRELGPVLSALMIVGQAGSAMAAEIGIQRNSEQIDALETIGVNPLGFLVGPRLVAALVVFPLHTAIFDLIGIVGGYVSGVMIMSMDGGVYWQNVYDGVQRVDVFNGFQKSLAFGFIVTAICAFEGFNTHRKSSQPGARGVSQSTTRAVVFSSIAVLAVDFVITSLLG
ncbi:MAG TPA: MlaE family lipid ABC transporter permease subunit [Opitutaceae bacterium]|nr:MlaE family lipid ABC transporter permease subunit [Opitutaceae bacterium]